MIIPTDVICAYDAYTTQMSIFYNCSKFEDRFGMLSHDICTYNDRVNGSWVHIVIFKIIIIPIYSRLYRVKIIIPTPYRGTYVVPYRTYQCDFSSKGTYRFTLEYLEIGHNCGTNSHKVTYSSKEQKLKWFYISYVFVILAWYNNVIKLSHLQHRFKSIILMTYSKIYLI